jgi:hypothetical protein
MDFGRERIAPYRQTTQQIRTPGRNRGIFISEEEQGGQQGGQQESALPPEADIRLRSNICR